MQERSGAWLWCVCIGSLCSGSLAACSEGSALSKPEPAVLTFWDPIELSTERAPQGHVLVADANADGWLDVLTWGDETQQLNLADAVQRGILRAREVRGLPSTNLKQAFWLDLNGDMAADLLVLDPDGKVRRFDNQFVTSADVEYEEVALSGLPQRAVDTFTVLDVDRDGELDLVTLGRVNDADVVRLDIYLGDGSGFAHGKGLVFADAGNTPEDESGPVLYPSDVDADGKWEIVVGAPSVGRGVVYFESGFVASGVDGGVGLSNAPLVDAGELDDASVSTLAADASDVDAASVGTEDAGGASETPQDVDDEGVRWQPLGAGTSFDGRFLVVDGNFDGVMDVVRFSPSEDPEILVGDGEGGFDSTAFEGIKRASVGCLEDFDNDTLLDVLTAGDTLALALGKKQLGAFEATVTLEGDISAESIACVDLDGDGDVDVLTSGAEGTKLYINGLEPLKYAETQFYGFRFRGKEGNFAALGSRVRVTVGERTQTREFVFPSHGASAPIPALHFGLGTEAVLDRVNIVWPSGVSRSDDDWEAGVVGTVILP